MTKQLDDMWSSKWVLPEHREALSEEDRSLKRIMKPVLDDQELEFVHNAIGQSISRKNLITLKVYDTTKYRTLEGIVTRIDHKLKQVKFVLHNPYEEGEPEWEWIKIADIVRVEVREVLEFDDVGWE